MERRNGAIDRRRSGFAHRAPSFFVALFLMATIAASLIGKAWFARLHSAERGLCDRVALLRATTNTANYGAYQFDRAVILGLAHPVREQNAKERRAAADFVALLRHGADQLEWLPATDCRKATDDPDHYAVPQPIKFSVALPPISALKEGSQ